MKDLVQLIRDNLGCWAQIDNDWWALYKTPPPEDDSDYDRWSEEDKLAESGEVVPRGDGGYGSGNCYGGDILQALAIIVGVKVESV